MGLNKVTKTDGESLCEVLKEIISKFGLEYANCVGYCFDGAANMSGINKGVATRLQEDCPLALYLHCYGHRLNLAIQSSLTGVLPLKILWELFKICTISSKQAPKDTQYFVIP